MKPGAIILAAGESKRMGRAKALLPFREGTFLSVLAATLSARCSPVIAVFGAEAEALMPCAPAGVKCVTNENYKLGMLTSLQAGLRELPRESPARALFTPVDHPAVSTYTVEILVDSRAPIAIPRFRGKRGHPVALGVEIIDEMLLEPASSKIHDVIDRHAKEIEYVDVNDPGIGDDVDDPELYRRLLVRDRSIASVETCRHSAPSGETRL